MAKKAPRNTDDITRRQTPLWLSVLVAFATVAASTAVSWWALDHRLPDVVMIYLLGVVVSAMRFGRIGSLLTAALGVAAFDFFFIPPDFSFAVTDKRFVLTLGIMLFVAFVISTLTEQVRQSAAAATEREHRTGTLYAMSRELSLSASREDIVRVASRHLHAVFASDIGILVRALDGTLRPVDAGGPALELSPDDVQRAQALLTSAPSNVSSEPALADASKQIVALRGSRGALGVLVVRPERSDFFASPANSELLSTFATQIAVALERAQWVEDEQRAKLEIRTERLRSALLSSVSHDLRTPLAVIKGAATALLDSFEELSVARRQEYMETISEEANRLNQLVRNLLNMTALEAGVLRVEKEWQPLEEVIGVALTRLSDSLKERRVEVDIPPDASLAPFDASLLEQVFVNLVENATKYAPGKTPIEIHAHRVEGGVEVEVADHGPGIPPGQEEPIFAKFHRVALTPTGGMGLGLTICRGIVAVHGGRIWCENRASGGAMFRFVLPIEGQPPAMNVLPEAIRT